MNQGIQSSSKIIIYLAIFPSLVPGKLKKFLSIAQCFFPPTLRQICKKFQTKILQFSTFEVKIRPSSREYLVKIYLSNFC